MFHRIKRQQIKQVTLIYATERPDLVGHLLKELPMELIWIISQLIAQSAEDTIGVIQEPPTKKPK